MHTVPRMTRLKQEIDNALKLFASDKRWSLSLAIAEIVANSNEISDYLTLDEKIESVPK